MENDNVIQNVKKVLTNNKIMINKIQFDKYSMEKHIYHLS